MRIGNHLGASFQIWNGGRTWFWFISDASRNSAVIGAAANEAEAIGEARLSIEEMAARRSAAEPPGISQAFVRATRQSSSAGSADLRLSELLVNLERYLARLCSECV